MNDQDITFFLDQYERYLNAAKEAQKKGNVESAKRNYKNAGILLLKIAKFTDSKKLKAARVEKAKSIIDLATNLNETNVLNYKNHTSTLPKNTGSKPSSGSSSTDDDEKKWSSAEIPNIHFSDIAGLEDVKESIRIRMINPILHPDKYKLYNKQTGGGVLLYGPPGTGKTMIAKAIACEVGAKFYAVKSSDIVSKWVGDSERNISSLFETARQDDRAIIFIDEMDSLFAARGEDKHNDKRVNEFLQQIDGFAGKNPNLLLLGATNRPWDIDSAATRSGRFSEKIYVHLPDADARKYLFKLYMKDIPLADDVNIDELVAKTNNFSGADISEVCDRAKDEPLLTAIENNTVVKVTQKDYLKAIVEVGSNINFADVSKFELYAKRNNAFLAANLKTKPVDAPKPQPNPTNLEIIVKDKEFEFVNGNKYSIEFYCSQDFEKLYINIDSKNLVCTKNIKNWKSTEFEVDKEGIYVVKVLNESLEEIGTFEVSFKCGIEEVDLGL